MFLVPPLVKYEVEVDNIRLAVSGGCRLRQTRGRIKFKPNKRESEKSNLSLLLQNLKFNRCRVHRNSQTVIPVRLVKRTLSCREKVRRSVVWSGSESRTIHRVVNGGSYGIGILNLR